MKTKKLLGVILVLALMICAFAAITTANAQECAWDLYVDGVKYSSSASYATSGKLVYNGSVVTLNNFTGKSIAAIPGGIYGDDDAPYLQIKLIGTNTLTGNYISQDTVYTMKPSGGTYWKGALYAQPRQGGVGENSRIRTLGTGTLNIDIRATSGQNGVNQKAVVCDNFDVAGDSVVNIKYGGDGITNSKIYAVDAYEANVRANYGTSSNSVLDIKAYASPYIDVRTQSVTASNCEVYGVTGTVNVETTNYFSIDNYTLTTGKTGFTCKNALIQAGSAAYFKTSASNGRYADIMLNVNTTLNQQQFTNSKYGYLAITPKTPNAASSLKPVSWMKVTENAPYPKYGDAKPANFDFADLTSMANCYLKLSAKYFLYGYPSSEVDSYDKFAEKTFGFYHEVIPAKGYYVKQTTPTVSEVKYNTSYPISLLNNNTLKLIYSYYKPTANLSKTVICGAHKDSNNNVVVSAGGDNKQYTYLWQYNKYLDGGVIGGCDIEAVNSSYGQAMGGINKYQLSIRGDWMTSCFYDDYDAQELNGIGLYCKIVSMPSGAEYETAECYYSWGHSFAYSTTKTQHVKVCRDPECSYVHEPSRADHVFNEKVLTPVTCTENGETEFTCRYCSYKEVKAISATGHNPVKLAAKESTCSKTGLTEGSKCSLCGEVLVAQNTVAKKSHDWGTSRSTIKDDTCTEAGLYEYTCVNCGATKQEAGKALGHSYTTKVKAATFSANGYKKTYCYDCSYVKSNTVYYKRVVTLSATSFVYNGKTQTPTVTVKDSNGKTLKKGTDYELYINPDESKEIEVAHKKAVGSYFVQVVLLYKNASGKECIGAKKNFTYKILPKQVTGLKQSKVTATTMALTWSKVTGVKYYKVEKYDSANKKWVAVKTVDTNTITITKLTAGTKYNFRVTALDSTKKLAGKVSATLKVQTLCVAPTITVKSTKSKTITVSWKKCAGASKYLVYTSTDGKKWTKSATVTGTSATVSKLSGGKKIYVKAYAVNAYSQNSGVSKTVSVTVKK